MAILALAGGTNLSAQGMHHELQSVTNTEHGHAQFEDAPIRGRRVGVVDRGWTARKNDAKRGIATNFLQSGSAREHDRKNILFTDAARNQLRILRPEVEDY